MLSILLNPASRNRVGFFQLPWKLQFTPILYLALCYYTPRLFKIYSSCLQSLLISISPKAYCLQGSGGEDRETENERVVQHIWRVPDLYSFFWRLIRAIWKLQPYFQILLGPSGFILFHHLLHSTKQCNCVKYLMSGFGWTISLSKPYESGRMNLTNPPSTKSPVSMAIVRHAVVLQYPKDNRFLIVASYFYFYFYFI